MFVQSKTTIFHNQKNGVALRQRRGDQETLVQWQNGQRRWVPTSDLAGTIRIIDREAGDDYDE